jgi:hypothetical protein
MGMQYHAPPRGKIGKGIHLQTPSMISRISFFIYVLNFLRVAGKNELQHRAHYQHFAVW